MSSIKITVDSTPLKTALEQLSGTLSQPRPLMLEIAEILHAQSMSLFHNEGWPSGSWPALRPSTRRARERSGHWPGKILQVSGRLASSVQAAAGDDFAQVGTNTVYAAIQHLGGTIRRTGSVRLRTKASGELVRQRGHPNLAVLARSKHKRATSRAVNYIITIPARPFLPVTPDNQLIPPAMDAVMGVLQAAFKKTR
ncbi:phage virion morphogenesis protein [Salmonella enterica]|nr:phage virion morphogenesis protein [Salmonella enterica]EFP4633795.1 phage virion morphogenesis protein [Salmonella enterica]EFS0362255.1 phage virion morphogenesis protein [Salmonella enterica]EGK1504565.1 phage virion morphogenesis protein [Salmonella enterica]